MIYLYVWECFSYICDAIRRSNISFDILLVLRAMIIIVKTKTDKKMPNRWIRWIKFVDVFSVFLVHSFYGWHSHDDSKRFTFGHFFCFSLFTFTCSVFPFILRFSFVQSMTIIVLSCLVMKIAAITQRLW